MKTYLATLAQAILAGSPKGVSKVRFAKLIYLLHKSLVQSGKERPDRLEFQRLPLGPVPVGFFQLAKTLAANDISIQTTSYGLSYDAEIYRLKSGARASVYTAEVEHLLRLTERRATSDLVNYTHKEPSWLSNPNGATYYLSPADLKRKLRFAPATDETQADEIQDMQASLVRGMIEDMVQESSSLEYPEPR